MLFRSIDIQSRGENNMVVNWLRTLCPEHGAFLTIQIAWTYLLASMNPTDEVSNLERMSCFFFGCKLASVQLLSVPAHIIIIVCTF